MGWEVQYQDLLDKAAALDEWGGLKFQIKYHDLTRNEGEYGNEEFFGFKLDLD